MSKPLKHFLNEAPTIGELEEVWDELENDGARGAAITAAVFIDEMLKATLKFRLQGLDGRDLDELFEGTAPLATFSGRIKIGHGLRVFGKKTRHDLERIKTIHNAFAHSRRALSFETAAIAELVSGLHAAKNISDREDHDAKTIYLTCCRIMIIHLIAGMNPIDGQEPLKVDEITELD